MRRKVSPLAEAAKDHAAGGGSEPVKVLYGGYLPVFGLTGSHPIYEQLLDSPPPGYEFVCVRGGQLTGVAKLERYLTERLLGNGKSGLLLNDITKRIRRRETGLPFRRESLSIFYRKTV